MGSSASSQIADSDCSHDIKRCLLFGRNAMTKLGSLLKSRNNTLLTKVCLVKTMVFPVVMYRCDSWTLKKDECQGIDAFRLLGWRRLLRVPWTARRSNQSILKEISPEYSLEGLMLTLKLQYSGHHMWRANSLEKTLMLGKIEGKMRSGQQSMRWLDGIINSMDMRLRKLQKTVRTGKPGVLQSVEVLSWIWLSNWTTTTRTHCFSQFSVCLYFFSSLCTWSTRAGTQLR